METTRFIKLPGKMIIVLEVEQGSLILWSTQPKKADVFILTLTQHLDILIRGFDSLQAFTRVLFHVSNTLHVS